MSSINIDKFPRVIQGEGKLQLIAEEKPHEGKQGKEKIISTKKIEDQELCNSPLINQGGHTHSEAYGIAWKRFFFGRLFG